MKTNNIQRKDLVSILEEQYYAQYEIYVDLYPGKRRENRPAKVLLGYDGLFNPDMSDGAIALLIMFQGDYDKARQHQKAIIDRMEDVLRDAGLEDKLM
jgi:hypothetical protein